MRGCCRGEEVRWDVRRKTIGCLWRRYSIVIGPGFRGAICPSVLAIFAWCIRGSAVGLGAPWLSWHTLRRTHATLLQAAGGSIKDAQAQLGHTKLSTTLEIYTLPVPEHQRAAVENLARMVTNGDERKQRAEGLPETTQQIQ